MALSKFQLSTTTLFERIISLKNHSLITTALVYVLGNTLQKALLFFLIPVYTRFLTPEDYAITGLTLVVGTVLTVGLGFGVNDGIVRYYYDYYDSPERLKQFITTNFLFLIFAAGIMTLILTYWGEGLWLKITSGQVPFSPYIHIVLWSSFASILFQTPLLLYRVQQNAYAYMIAQVANFSLNLAATILFVVVWRMGAVGQLLGIFVGVGTTAILFSALMLKRWYSLYLRWEDIRLSLVYGLPLIPHALSGWVMNSIDRILLESRVPLTELGLYTLGYQLGVAMLILVSSINLAWSPYYYNLMKSKPNPEKVVHQVSAFYVTVIGGICLIGTLFSQEILFVLAPSHYQAAARYVPLILFSYLLEGYYYFAIIPVFYYKKTHWVPFVTLGVALLNVGLNLWWIPFWGALGSAWATLGAYLAALIIAYFLGRRWQKVNYPLTKFGVANGLIFVGVLFGTYRLSESYHLSNLIWKSSLLILYIIFTYLWLVKPNLKLLNISQLA